MTLLADPRTLIRTAAHAAFAPRENLTVSEWAERYRQIKIGAQAGQWRNERTPYLREVMDAAADPNVAELVIMKGSQTGGTEALYNAIMYWVDQAPGMCMFVYPDADSAQDQNELRFLPTLRSTPKIAAHLSTRKHDTKARSIQFDSMPIMFRGAHSEHKLESNPCRYVVVDELDRCPPETAHLVRQRVKTYPDSKVLLNGKPGLEGEGIDAAFSVTDKRRYWTPCPHCREYHCRNWGGIRWRGARKDGTIDDDSRDAEADPQVALDTAWFKCPNCKGRCEAKHNRWQLTHGLWLSEGQRISPMPDADTPGTVVGARPRNRAVGYHIPGWISGLRPNPYAEAAAEYCRRKGMVDQHLVNDQWGEAWKQRGEVVAVGEISKRAVKVSDGGYKLGAVPLHIKVLLASVDIQNDLAYIEVRGYGERAKDRALVWCGSVPVPLGLGLDVLDAVLYNRTFRREDGREMRIFARIIDSGARTTEEVYPYVRNRQMIWAAKGYGLGQRASLQTPYRISHPERTPDGKPLEGGTRLVMLDTHYWKQLVIRKLKGNNEPDPTTGDTLPIGEWLFPEDTPGDYFKQLVSEECVGERRGTQIAWVWKIRQGFTDNHYFDCAVYNEVLADMLRLDDRLVTAPEPVAVPRPTPDPRQQQAPRVSAAIQMQRQSSLIKSLRR